jgi:hypothetical protein
MERAAMTEPELLDCRGLFSGRQQDIAELYAVIAQPGQHAVIYGERGVGSASLAVVVAELLRGRRPYPSLDKHRCDDAVELIG